MVDEHTHFTRHSIFMLEINCNTEDSKKARLKLKSYVNYQNDDYHNKCNKNKFLSIAECFTGESKHLFSKLTEETIRTNVIDWCDEKCHFTRKCALKILSALKLEHNLRKINLLQSIMQVNQEIKNI